MTLNQPAKSTRMFGFVAPVVALDDPANRVVAAMHPVINPAITPVLIMERPIMSSRGLS
jgi:hypothetical protein